MAVTMPQECVYTMEDGISKRTHKGPAGERKATSVLETMFITLKQNN